MSVADAGKFFNIASQDPAILRRLGEGPGTLPDVMGRVVSEAHLLGIAITADDAQQWISSQQPQPAAAPVQHQEKIGRLPPFPGDGNRNTEPLLPPTDSFAHFMSWVGGQIPSSNHGHAGRRT